MQSEQKDTGDCTGDQAVCLVFRVLLEQWERSLPWPEASRTGWGSELQVHVGGTRSIQQLLQCETARNMWLQESDEGSAFVLPWRHSLIILWKM